MVFYQNWDFIFNDLKVSQMKSQAIDGKNSPEGSDIFFYGKIYSYIIISHWKHVRTDAWHQPLQTLFLTDN